MHEIYKRDIGYSSFDFQGYRIDNERSHPPPPGPMMTPSIPLPPPRPHHILYKPHLSLMHVNEYALFLLPLGTGTVSAYQRAGAMQVAENSAWFVGYVLFRPSQRFWRTRDHSHFLSRNIGKYLWWQFMVTKLIFGNREILKITLWEHGRLFLGNTVPPGEGLFSGVALHASR